MLRDMRKYHIEYKIKNIEKVEWVKASSSTKAVAAVMYRLSRRDKFNFKIVCIKMLPW